MKRIALAVCAFALAFSSSAAMAQRLSNDDAGRLTAEMDSQRQEYLKKEFDGRSPEQLNAHERQKYEKKSMEIEKQVLKDNNVSRASYNSTMMHASKGSSIDKSREQHAKRIDEQKKAEEAKKAEAAKKSSGSADGTENGVVVERGNGAASSGAVKSVEGGVTVERGGM